MTKKRIAIWSTALIALVFLGAWWLLSGRTERPAAFRVGFNTWVGYGPFYIAQEKGYFRRAGLDVRLERIEGTGERRAALIAGRLEAMGSTVDDLLVGVEQGVRARCVLLIDESNGADGIIADARIERIEDLRGQRIAVQPGFVNHFFLLYLLDKHGISPSEVTVVPLDPDKAGAAFIHGDVDVAVTWEPYLSQAVRERRGARRLVDTSTERHVIVDILAVSEQTLSARPDDVRTFVDAWFAAVDFYMQHPEEATAIIGRAMALDLAEAKDMLSGVRFVSRGGNQEMMASGALLGVMQKANELWVRGGFLKASQPVDRLIDSSFVR